MTLLLDTHTFIWSLVDKRKLSKKVVFELEEESNLVFVSAVSLWEISIKTSLGKLSLGTLRPSDLVDSALETSFSFIDMTIKESSTFFNLTITDHKDPFDRMLAWQAISRNFILVTSDASLQKNYASSGLKVFW